MKDPLLIDRWKDEAWPEHYELSILVNFIILHHGSKIIKKIERNMNLSRMKV